MTTFAHLPQTIEQFDSAIITAQTIGDVARIITGIKSASGLLPAEKVLLLTHAAEREQQILEYYLPAYSLTASVVGDNGHRQVASEVSA